MPLHRWDYIVAQCRTSWSECGPKRGEAERDGLAHFETRPCLDDECKVHAAQKLPKTTRRPLDGSVLWIGSGQKGIDGKGMISKDGWEMKKKQCAQIKSATVDSTRLERD